MRRAIVAGAAYFAIVFAAGFVLGVIRVLVLAPRLGATAAVLVELPVIVGISWGACCWLVRRLAVSGGLTPRLLMGGVAFALLIGAEAGLSVFAFGRSLAEHLAQYREAHALLGLAGQVIFGLLPALVTLEPDRAGD